jgi:hypothetical protein
MITINFYEGSRQYYTRVTTSTDIKTLRQIILNGLRDQYKYRPTTEDLWAELTIGETMMRFTFNPAQLFLTEKSWTNYNGRWVADK